MLRGLAEEQHSGAVALVETKDGIWQGAAGRAEGKRRTQPQDRFGIASTTKTFVATVVLQLVGEGRLSLEDSVEQRLPGRLRYGKRITIRQLLNHTSGLWDFASHLPGLHAQPALQFVPGTRHGYANMNYIVLGLIVERVTGRRLELVVRDHIFRPLRLANTTYGRVGPREHGGRGHAWLGAPEENGSHVTGASGIVSTVADLATFFRALVGGELLNDELQGTMMQTVATGSEFRAGLGLFQARLRCGYPWGHGGDEPAYSNQVLASRDGSMIVVVAQNTSGWPNVKAKAEAMYCRAL
jgi:D-alanyl-D-alanine carboxypeptidase